MAGLHEFNIRRDELSDLFGRGIPRGSILMIEGPFGCGKSILCQRLAYGLLMHDLSVTFITTELTVKSFIDQMYSLDYKIAKSLLMEKLMLIPVYPLIGTLKGRKGFLQKLMSASHLFDNDILIIDTLSSLMANSLDGEEKAIELMGLLKRLSALNKTTIITMESGILKDSIMSHFRADSHIFTEIRLKEVGGMLTRNMKVNRFLNTENPVNDNIGFKVVPKVGIVIEITTVG